jgi:hypothetical protein
MDSGENALQPETLFWSEPSVLLFFLTTHRIATPHATTPTATTMATLPPSSLALMSGRKKPIKEVNVNDVLLGRGLKLSGFPGNLAFRKLCDERKAEYKSTKLRKEKRQIAQEIRDEIHSRGGRFLKQDFQVHPAGNDAQECLFIADDGAMTL